MKPTPPIALFLLASALAAQGDPVARVYAELRELATARPARVRVEEWGRSRAGRPILVAALTEGSGARVLEQRPGILLVAGLDGRRIDDVEVAMRNLLAFAGARKGSELARRLETATLYVLPIANPDGLVARSEGNLAPDDEDRDGREGEDSPDDLDGDGRIVWMRVRDPKGPFIADPMDERLLRRADPKRGERGVYRVWREGRDDDGDGRQNEDAPGGTIPDNNFPHRYREHAEGAGRFVLSEPAALALVKLVLAKRNLSLVVCYGAQDNLLASPKKNSVKGRASPDGILDDDLWIFEACGESYREITGRDKAKNVEEQDGTFVAWCYAQAGIPCLATSLSRPGEARAQPGPDPGIAKEAGEPIEAEPVEAIARKGKRARDEAPGKAEREKLAWILDRYGQRAFVPWHTATHPELGAVEVGGLDPAYEHRLPPADLAGLAASHLEFLASLFDRPAAPGISKVERRALGNGVHELTLTLTNEGFLPPRSAMARKLRRPRAPKLELLVDGDDGRPVLLTRSKTGPAILFGEAMQLIDSLEGKGSHTELRYVLRAPPGTTIQVKLGQEDLQLDEREVKF